MNNIYNNLSNLKPIAKSYTSKFLFIAFLGIHIPLIGLIIFLISFPGSFSVNAVGIATLVFTLGATGLTLYIINGLLSPLKMSKNALDDYLNSRIIPTLPTHYKDEAGILMLRVQETVTSLDALLEEKKDLIGLLSHDLRTPLASILLLSGVLERQAQMDDEQRKEIARMILDSTKEQMSLFQKILDLLRNDDIPHLQLHLEQVSVDDLIKTALKDMQPMADEKELDIEISGEQDKLVKADSTLIVQVIKNLFSNAIKFSHRGATIKVNTSQQQGKTNIVFADNGLGFNPMNAEQLFQRFTSITKAGTDNEASTGMGLYLSRKIMTSHGGTLHAKSTGVNEGATFTIAFN